MHYKKVKSILSPKNGMNIYRGCTHGCIYCDSRSTCYQFDHEFEDIQIKENALELLEQALFSKRNKCMIGTGSMTDPYIPLEENFLFMRRALDIIYKYNFGATIITKSNLILRDLDILQKINHNSKAVLQITLTTYDEKLCKIIEPNVCTTKERVKILTECKKLNIPTVVWLCPILPFINDTEENLRAILQYCIDENVYGIICFGFGLTLREGNREYFYKKLDQHFPGLKEKYQRIYGSKYFIESPNSKKLYKIFKQVCDENNIVTDNNIIFEYLNSYPEKYQKITLFD